MLRTTRASRTTSMAEGKKASGSAVKRGGGNFTTAHPGKDEVHNVFYASGFTSKMYPTFSLANKAQGQKKF